MITTPVVYAIHSENESPLFGIETLHISAESNGGGVYVKLKNINPAEPEEGSEISLDIDILEEALKIAKLFEANITNS